MDEKPTMDPSKNKRGGNKKWSDSVIGFYIIFVLIVVLTAVGMGYV